MSGYEKVQVDIAKADALVRFLLSVTDGPQEAFALLCIGLVEVNKLNKKITGIDVTRDKLIEEVGTSIRSLTIH